jgi:Zn-dependent protease/CBS domain-containing protein
MEENLRLGRIAGIRVGANWSLVVVFGLMVWALAGGQLPQAAPGHSGITYVVVALCLGVAFYGCLLLHELAHSLVARRRGIEVDGIVLWLLGGVSRMKGEPADPNGELVIAAAGPATSLAMAAGFFALSGLASAGFGATLAASALGWLGWINGILGVFNLTPAFPLDGGRVLRSLLWRHYGDKRRATDAAARVGRGFGYGFIGVGSIGFLATGAGLGGLWLAAIGWFLLSAGREEANMARWSTAGSIVLRSNTVESGPPLAGIRVRDAMTPDPLTVPAWVTLDQLLAEGVYRRQLSSFPVVDAAGTFVGLVTLARIRPLPVDRRIWTTAGQIAVPAADCLTCAPDDDLAAVVPRMAASPDRRAVVLERGRVVGIVSPSDVGRTAARLAERPDPAAAHAV